MRTRRFTLALFTALAVGLAGAGCSDDSTTNPTDGFTQQDADDAAVQASIALANLSAILQGAGSDGGSAARTDSDLRLRSGPGGFGVQADTTWTQGALVITLSRRWFSLTGTEQVVPDANTDSVLVTSRIAGSDSTARYVVTVGHAGTSSIGGLNPLRDEYWLRIAQADTLTSRFTALHRPVTRYFDGRTTTNANHVRWIKPTTAEPTYPASGTLTLTLAAIAYRDAARLDVEKSWNAIIVVTFNGTRYPDVAINGAWFYVWDLETGQVHRGNSA